MKSSKVLFFIFLILLVISCSNTNVKKGNESNDEYIKDYKVEKMFIQNNILYISSENGIDYEFTENKKNIITLDKATNYIEDIEIISLEQTVHKSYVLNFKVLLKGASKEIDKNWTEFTLLGSIIKDKNKTFTGKNLLKESKNIKIKLYKKGFWDRIDPLSAIPPIISIPIILVVGGGILITKLLTDDTVDLPIENEAVNETK